MLRNATCFAILALVVVPLPASAQISLAWKFREGESLLIENVEKTRQVLTLKKNGKRKEEIHKSGSTVTTRSRFTVKQKTAKETVLTIKIEDIATRSTAAEGGKDLDKDVAGKMKGAVFIVTLDPSYKITKLEGFEELIKKIAGGNEEIEKLVRARMTEETLKKSLEEPYQFLPGKPVAKGDSWKQNAVVPLGLFGSFKVIKTFTYKGKEAAGELIAFTSAMTYSPPTGEGGLLKIVKADLKGEDGAGTFLFDNDKGRLVRGDNHVAIRGSLVVEIMEELQPIDLEVEVTNSIRVLTKD
ncbi:MAG: hypothetical protein FJ271_32135 [Planctomycetes bacterium]|nr:hypothetical protein [Planctomycetota bacterium]